MSAFDDSATPQPPSARVVTEKPHSASVAHVLGALAELMSRSGHARLRLESERTRVAATRACCLTPPQHRARSRKTECRRSSSFRARAENALAGRSTCVVRARRTACGHTEPRACTPSCTLTELRAHRSEPLEPRARTHTVGRAACADPMRSTDERAERRPGADQPSAALSARAVRESSSCYVPKQSAHRSGRMRNPPRRAERPAATARRNGCDRVAPSRAAPAECTR
jgi:hypothetical protein